MIDTENEYIDCTECDGTGCQEEHDCSVGSASICCGGCFKTVPCVVCTGTGEIENPNFELINED